METTQIPISIYTEATPNPEALKFVANKMLIPSNSAHFESADQTKESELASQLFVFPFVKEVFIMNNFVTVTKLKEYDWYEVMHDIRHFLKEFLETDQEVIQSSYFATEQTESAGEDSEVIAKIKNVLETYVKPAVEMDGGAIEFVNFENGKVELVLKGACSGCPSSTVTLKQGIEEMMKRMVPDVTEVTAVAG